MLHESRLRHRVGCDPSPSLKPTSIRLSSPKVAHHRGILSSPRSGIVSQQNEKKRVTSTSLSHALHEDTSFDPIGALLQGPESMMYLHVRMPRMSQWSARCQLSRGTHLTSPILPHAARRATARMVERTRQIQHPLRIGVSHFVRNLAYMLSPHPAETLSCKSREVM